MLGVDYPWTHPDPAALQASGVTFALRYLSTDPSKNLTRAEADALAAVGIWSGVVWETTAGRALAGQAAGASDAHTALQQARDCGMPDGRPVYFAVDTDTTWSAVQPYFTGVASVLAPEQVGMYGGLHVVQGAADSGLVSWYWQASAWSGGVWDPRAHIRQLGSMTVGGVDCDHNEAMTPDFGQWMPGINPQEDDMPTADEIAAAVWNFQVPRPQLQPDGTVNSDQRQAAMWPLGWGNIWAARSQQRDAALQGAIASLAGLLAAQHTNLTSEQITAAVEQGIANGLVHVKVEVTGTTTPTT